MSSAVVEIVTQCVAHLEMGKIRGESRKHDTKN